MHIPKPVKPKRVQVVVRVLPEQRDRLRAIAVDNRCTLARVLEFAIEELLDRAAATSATEPSAPASLPPATLAAGGEQPLHEGD